MYNHGPGNGTLLLLPVDQGLEHGPRDFIVNPDAKDPEYQLHLADEGHFSGIVFNIGLAEKYMNNKHAGRVPLVLKLNGKTEVPSDNEPLSPCIATVKDAVRLGADAVGYTLYVGSPRQTMDFNQFRAVREEAERYEMPIIVWAYPRGEAIEARGGPDSLYAIDYAARAALELGADIVKINVPKISPEHDAKAPKPYGTLQISREEAVRMVVESAGRALLICSGGEMQSEESIFEKARLAMESGFIGLIFARNFWQRPFNEALTLTAKFHELLGNYGV
jgi:class I fructose-bisphosphate aldolase